MKSIKDADISAQTRVLVRCDLDVAIEDGKVLDTFRLDCALPTLNYIIKKGAFPVIFGHMGRPGGKVDDSLSTNVLKPYFDEKLGSGNYELLENTRFDSGEESNSEEYAKKLASKGDIFVNESFGTCHREHASTVGVTKFLDSYAGLRFIKEVEVLGKLVDNPEKPLVCIVGGKKVETKIPVVSKFLQISDAVLLGGKIGFMWDGEKPDNLFLPVDYVDEKDIGDKTVKYYTNIVSSAKTIIWVGPLGAFEDNTYARGTQVLGEVAVNSNAFCVAGGGDTIAAFTKFGLLNKFDFVSTGGGAMLEFLVKSNLPALAALNYHA